MKLAVLPVRAAYFAPDVQVAPLTRAALGFFALALAVLAQPQAQAQSAPAPAPAPAPVTVTGPAPAAAPQPPTLQKIRATGVITLAHPARAIPFSYYDANEKPVGYSLELCERVVEAIKRDLKMPALRTEYLAARTAAERIPNLLSGKADLECGNTTNTAARRKLVAFTVTHYFAGGRLLVPATSGVQRLGDLRSKTIAVNKGSTHASNLNAAIDKGILAARLIESKDAAEGFALLEKGSANAYLHDDIVLASLRANSASPKDWILVGDFLSVEPLAIMMRRDDPEFKKLVDVTLSRLMIDGQIRDIWRRWFESPIPPNGVNLGIVMNPMMRDQIRFPSDKVGDEIGG
jgi:glutamate/aspartate transport system substrate-binding protein